MILTVTSWHEMAAGWPRQRRLIQELRDILRREFGCQDAWVVNAGGHCRLDVRIQGRQLSLLEDAEDRFWAMFYVPVERSRLHLGERVVQVQQRKKSSRDLVAVLTPYWIDRVGQVPRLRSPRPGSGQARQAPRAGTREGPGRGA